MTGERGEDLIGRLEVACPRAKCVSPGVGGGEFFGQVADQLPRIAIGQQGGHRANRHGLVAVVLPIET